MRVAEPLLAHLRSTFDDDSLVYRAPPRPLGPLWHYVVEGLPAGVPAHQVVRVAADQTAVGIEAAVLAAAFEGGLPVPELVLDGRDFLAMEFVEGQPLLTLQSPAPRRLLGDRWRARGDVRSASVLGALLADLHRVDVTAVVSAMAQTDAAYAVGLDRPFRLLEDALGSIGEPTLLTAYERLLARRPTSDHRLALCHGRLGPQTVRQIDGRVSAITGWNQAVVADPAYDLGATLAELRAFDASTGRRSELAAAVVRVYGDLLSIDEAAVAWFEAFHCLRFVAHRHLAAATDASASQRTASLRSTANVVTTLTGVDLHLAA